MSKITVEEVENLAVLARVGLTDAEKSSLAREMNEILEYAKQLDEVDVSGVEPTAQVAGLTNVSREDLVSRSDICRDELLANTSDTDKGFIKVKNVL